MNPTNNRAALEASESDELMQTISGAFGTFMRLAHPRIETDVNKLSEALAIVQPGFEALLRQAERDILIANEKELTRRLKLLQNQFKSERDNNSLVFTYVFDQVGQTTNKERIAALVALQVGPQGVEGDLGDSDSSGGVSGSEQIKSYAAPDEPTKGSL